MAASASALSELASLVSSGTGRQGSPLYLRLSHFEHGGFLNPLLFGFWILPATGELSTRPATPGLEDEPPPPASVLRSVDQSSPEYPAVYAVVANHPVSIQIEHTLSALAMMVARQEFLRGGISDVVTRIDELTAEMDVTAKLGLADSIRPHGWRAAAAAIAARAQAAGFSLIVSYSPILMDEAQLALRAPILRRVYNELPAVRRAVDKVAALLSQGMMTIGDGSESVAAFARDLLDVGSIRTYLAHLARDSFVCGNGYLAYGSVPDEDTHLLLPESVRTLSRLDGGLVTATAGDGSVYQNVLHFAGAEQQGSSYGLSVLEPFVQIQSERELALWLLGTAEAYERISAPEEFRLDAAAKVPLARRTLGRLESRITDMLGGPSTLHVDPPADLYFSGHELMAPAADGLSNSVDG